MRVTPSTETSFYGRREAVREAAWQAHLKELEKEHRKRVAANKKLHDAQVRRQKEFLRSIGVPDLSPEEIMERARRRPSASVRLGLPRRAAERGRRVGVRQPSTR